MDKKNVVMRTNYIINSIVNDNSIILPDFLENFEDVKIREDLDLINDLKFDSLMLITMIVEIEKEFDIEFPDEMLLFDTLRCCRGLYDTIWGLVYNRNSMENKVIED